ncbi:MAG: YfhO family protein [Tyzzerella sp.]|nr:YfhO family protein [Tyzzerella sp.]
MKKHLILIAYGLLILGLLLGFGNLFGSRVDWLGQHIVFPDTFRQAFYESGQLIPNFLFSIGGGQNVFNFIYYGFLSPGILLSYLLPFVDMTTYIIVLSILSYLASGVLVYRFLKQHFDETKAFWAAILFMTLPPMTYHFHHHIMFVWYLPFFIMALMGLDRYFEKKRSGMFILSAFFMILTNYYFSVGSFVFLFVYAVYRLLMPEYNPQGELLVNKSDKIRTAKRIMNSVILFTIPVLMSGFVLLPTAYTLFANGRTSTETETLTNLIIPSYEELFYSPYSMGITAVMLIVVIGILTCKNRKRSDIFLNIFAIFVLICPAFMYVLNGMLYARGKVLIAFSVIFLYLFCRFLEHLEKQEIHLKRTFLLAIGFVVLLLVLCVDNRDIGLLLLAELGVLWFYRKLKQVWYVCPVLIAFIMTCMVHTSEQYVTIDYYKEMYTDEVIELMEQTEENFYRSHVMYREKDTANKVYGKNFHGSSVYSSTANSLYERFYENDMGNNEMYRNCFITAGARNELFYSFMGTKYIISEKDPGLYYEQIEQGKHLNLYESKYAYPVAYKSQNIMSEDQFDNTEFPYTSEYLMTHTIVEDGVQTDYKTVLNACDVSEQYTFVQKKAENYTIELDESYRNQLIYLSFDIMNKGDYLNNKDISITINGVKNKLTAKNAMYYNGNIKFDFVVSMEDTTELRIEITKGKYDIRNLKMYTSGMIYSEYEEVDALKINEGKGIISCTTEAKEGEYLVTSFPYDKGFYSLINGEDVEIELVNKAFVGLRLKEGKNDVVIKYKAPFFAEGVLVSIVGVLLLIVVIFKEWIGNKIAKYYKKHREVILYLIFGVLTTLVSLFTYFVCVSFFLDTTKAMELQTANIIAWFVSVLFAYVTNRRYVFQSQGGIGHEMVKFYLSRIGTLGMDMFLMHLLVTAGGIQDGIAKVIVQVFVIVANYILGKLLVFKEEYK